MKNFSLLLLTAFFFFGCRQNVDTSVIEALKSELDKTTTELAACENQSNNQERLVHIVWFKLKPEVNSDGLITEIKKLKTIEVLNNLEVGKFQDLGDTRAMSDLDLVMQMSFDSEKDYQTYQKHPIHLTLKKAAGKFLDAPPVTYDFWTE